MAKKSNIYTLTGDAGMTSLAGGQRVSKSNARVEAYGSVDELNSHIGLLLAAWRPGNVQLSGFLQDLQSKLFSLGAYLATPSQDGMPQPALAIDEAYVKEIENLIDSIDASLPSLRGFVLPGGTLVAACCDLCRTTARRAERRIVELAQTAPVHSTALQLVNRLSDFFFVLERRCNLDEGMTESYWNR